MEECKYFIEQKDTQLWLTITGELTNDPYDQSIISSKKSFELEKWLKPMSEKWNSNFAGNVMRRDEGRDMLISMQKSIKARLELKNIDLYSDFIITEHLFC